jgi:hypothetical protein
MILISGPSIARLALHTRKWAHEHLRRGTFGPITIGSDGVLYAEVTNVEHALKQPITAERLAALGLHVLHQEEAA